MKLSDVNMVILCGGLGTRLRSTIGESQKTMARIGDEPFLSKVLRLLKVRGFRKIILAVGYQADQVEECYRKNDLGLNIVFSREDNPLGTGGAIKNAKKFIHSDPFFAMNGDCFSALSYVNFLQYHLEHNNAATLSVVHISDTRDYGTIVMGDQSRIKGFEEKKDIPGGGFVNLGAYCFNQSIIDLMPQGAFSIEKEFFPLLPEKLNERFSGFIVQDEFLDIGTPDRYAKAEDIIRKVSPK